MDSDDDERDDFPDYRDPADISAREFTRALGTLNLFNDPYLRTQAFNLAIVDKFIMELEYEVLRKLNEEEHVPMEATFLSAQTQMWIFAVYEILRTWRERAKEVVKLKENGGLKLKVDALRRDRGFRHFGRELRADQIEAVIDSPKIIDDIKVDLRFTHIPFVRIQHIRVALAKHEVGGRKKSIAYAPGHGRINQWCGSLEFELENDGAIMGQISRRDIADELRALSDRSNPPSDEDLQSFDAFMKRPDMKPFEEGEND